jgi:hypothetical protein
MGKKVGVWIDSERAYIISLFDDRHVMETVESNVETRVRYEGETKSYSGRGGSTVNPSKKKTKRRKHQMDSYLMSVVDKLGSAEGIYIFGPAECKLELQKCLIKRKDKPSVYMDKAERMTERQMVAKVRDYFNQ